MAPLDRDEKRVFFTLFAVLNILSSLIALLADSLLPVYVILFIDFIIVLARTIWIISGKLFK